MSEENVEIVRRLAEWFQRRQHEQAFEFYDPEIEWDSSRRAALHRDNAGVYHGHDEVRAFWRDWLSAWSDLQFEIEDVVDGGEEIVLLTRNQRQWGRHSGIETEVPPYGGDRGDRVVRVRLNLCRRSVVRPGNDCRSFSSRPPLQPAGVAEERRDRSVGLCGV
jgi:hypothetical protein